MTSFDEQRAGDPFKLAGRVVFFVYPLADGPLELWTSDGTATHPLFDLAAELADVQAVQPLGEVAYFAARDAHAGLQFYVTDGTANGTRRVTRAGPGLLPPNYESYPFFAPRFTLVGGQVFFALCPDLERSRDCGLWRTHGTLSSTELVRQDPNLVFGSSGFAVLGERLYFLNGDALWSSDGTVAGTRRVSRVTKSDFLHGAAQRLLGDDLTYVLEPKLDGLSLELVYEDGALVRAATRGDGLRGEGTPRPAGLQAGARTQVAFAVWEGAHEEAGSRKMRAHGHCDPGPRNSTGRPA